MALSAGFVMPAQGHLAEPGHSPETESARSSIKAPGRIVSLDFCADQFVLKLAERRQILALSPDAEKPFSYLREQARGIVTVRPRAEEVVPLKPDLVVRSFGGGPRIEQLLAGAGIPVVQVGYALNLAYVETLIVRLGERFGQPLAAARLTARMQRRQAELRRAGEPRSVLYVTPSGVTGGPDTLAHTLVRTAGHVNYQQQPGWRALPLEDLVYRRPDLIATAFFADAGRSDMHRWSTIRHPLARALMHDIPVVPLRGAWTACTGWFLMDAVEALAGAGRT